MNLSLIDRYLAKNIFVPLVGTLIVAAMLLVLDKMLRLFDFVVALGGPVSVVWRMLANMLPEYFALGIPIGLLLGILLAFRKLALSSELDALRGIGVGYGRLLRVPYMYAGALLLLNLVIVSYVEPYARYNYEGLRFDLRSGSLGASIEVGEFNKLGNRMTLRIDESENDGTMLKGIFVHVDDRDDGLITASARQGQFLATDDPDVIIFRLRDGRLVQDNPDFPSPRTLAFDSYDLPINLPAVDVFRGRGNQIRELTLPELAKLAYFTTGADPGQNLAARANLHFRLVEVIMMLMLPLLAIALAVPPKRSSSSLGIFVAIVMVVTYHKINQYAESAGAQGRLQPELALYIPFVVFVVLIGWMYHVIAHRPGGQPIGALEAGFAKIAKAVRKLVPDPRAKALAARRAARMEASE
ncbi:LPS export ABC transporter permease LptF [Sphingomicrobium lutaoense]|uniref:Lipopolysaccharide export system permease protein n=1 Tax=Sphingomicrobium lutaoense TaxID=515949 RepID=A0A839Z0N7_9SPHN|nr:LPS export ABC transporter permease LptF [Sphingomicrobium lutaoense]MBB3763125.1 lipopolysaccharide export system permease protein [Sphingomicrobium lutaoense]